MAWNMKKLILLFVLLYAHFSSASVIMVGTRVIISSGSQEKTIQFRNPDSHPYVVEIKITKENENASASVPFAVVPPVFRIEANQGQSVRLISTAASASLPRDRESVFYLNFTQIPSIKTSEAANNQLIIAVKSRIKVFYRPDSLAGQQSDAYKALKFSLNNGHIQVENPTGFYISISSAEFTNGRQKLPLAGSVMLAPFSSMEWSRAGNIASLRGGKILITQVNDYGAYVEDARDL